MIENKNNQIDMEKLARGIFRSTLIGIVLCETDLNIKTLKLCEQILKGKPVDELDYTYNCIALAQVKGGKRTPENVAAYLVYKISRAEEKDAKKRKKMYKKIGAGYSFSNLKRDLREEPDRTFEFLQGTNLTKEDMKNLVGREIKFERIEHAIKQRREKLRDEGIQNP